MSIYVNHDAGSGSTALLTVDLAAIGENYSQLSALAKGAECGAVVKADAYGMGAEKVAPYLHAKGCKTFFVATLSEGIKLRSVLRDAKLYVLDGFPPGSSAPFLQHDLSPVLGSLSMMEEWSVVCSSTNTFPRAALHIDTGMNRLGVGSDKLDRFIQHQKRLFNSIEPDLIMSHLACADESDHPRNQKQLQLFKEIASKLPSNRLSLANSAGIFLGSDFSFDLVRPGIALYGGRSVKGADRIMRSVVSLKSKIAQIRTVEKGDAIGYGATYVVPQKTRLATVPVGYADGYHRALGATNERAGASAYIGDYEAPLLGRVSMDLMTIDITDIPNECAHTGAEVELLGPHVSIDDLADIAGTIGYEILTSIGNGSRTRIARQTVGKG